ncbi:unnamed protein product [Gongylonema pulchrum]|uniref:L-Fucosyltransferase n=1 Tax=Gongylonema pulchrum TaxID=637853 RepID=A0A183ERL1_9BILA|nr:unnamed protein product [Gongylonema pulchrum]
MMLFFPVCCKYYENEIEGLFASGNFEYISGYLQTYRYFHPHQADGFLQEAKFEKIHAEAIVSGSKERDQVDIIQDFHAGRDYVYVGVHIRYGMDVTMNGRNLKHGHTAITKDYLINAMNFFRSVVCL